MRRAAARVVAALFVLPGVAHSAEAEYHDDICNRLDTFDRAAFDAPAVAHSIVFVWKPAGILGTVECLHWNERNAKALCGWLIENTSREFDEALPERILRCHGFEFPLMPNVRDWIALYDFWDEKENRDLLLEVDRGGLPDASAIRWTVFPTGKSVDSFTLTPLKDIPETRPDGDAAH
jgi:hypothetical protein